MNSINMFQIFLIWLTIAIFEASNGQIVITQTPAFIQANSGDKVTIQCEASSSMGSYMALYRFLENQKPKLLIYDVTNRFEGTPDRFSGSGSGTDFTFTINGVRPEDKGVYYCGQRQSFPLTFGQGTKLEITQREDATPLAFIFPPSKEQLKTNSATVVCLISSFYPSELNVTWKVDGKAATGDIQTSSATADTDKTYRLSSTLTLSTAQYNSHELYTCEVTHKTLSQPLVKSFKRSECSS